MNSEPQIEERKKAFKIRMPRIFDQQMRLIFGPGSGKKIHCTGSKVNPHGKVTQNDQLSLIKRRSLQFLSSGVFLTTALCIRK